MCFLPCFLWGILSEASSRQAIRGGMRRSVIADQQIPNPATSRLPSKFQMPGTTDTITICRSILRRHQRLRSRPRFQTQTPPRPVPAPQVGRKRGRLRFVRRGFAKNGNLLFRLCRANRKDSFAQWLGHTIFIASGSHFTTALRSRLRLLSKAAPAARKPNTASSTTGCRDRTAAKKFLKWS